ncbi:helix-turn-helix transcriptional regulator [Pelomonas sp. V22]|uniref:helix-turn-helix transcriptional regulator n=1 Tax=Pelomonas sp. V22 TaxID=2822139 RepID=UPI0024A8B2A0|nr:LuxR family transcriptional regulator [Pelomonas sp. V22]MDI4634426.1 helix-turn-helix transcriptional regulator [Pelomonas sp. V22]
MLELLDRSIPNAALPGQNFIERRRSPASGALLGQGLFGALAGAILDEIDYPVLLVDEELHLQHGNRIARSLLVRRESLMLEAGQLQLRSETQQLQLRRAVDAAVQRGRRSLIAPRGEPGQPSLAVLPAGPGSKLALVMLAKPALCQGLTLQAYAREHGLTEGEREVLGSLCAGHSPEEIAQQRKVALSTVRTQIGAIRAKTGARDIGALVRSMAVLPPLVHALVEGH